jgi:hypothetical protein
MEIRITSHNLGLSSRFQQFIEKKMRVIRRFVGDGVSAQVFLRRNAGTVPGSGLARGHALRCGRGKFSAFTQILGSTLLSANLSQSSPARCVSGRGAV